MSEDLKFDIWLAVCIACLFLAGFVVGYAHVIVKSQAYVVDGNAYHYEVSPEFYDRTVLH